MAEIPDQLMQQLADNIARLNEVMALHSAALVKSTGNTEDFEKILNRLNGTATQADKIEQQLLQKKIQREQYQESSVVKGTIALNSFGTALLSSTQGLEKYNAAIKGGFDSASDTFLSFGTKAGNAASIISKGIGFATTQINEYTSRVIKAYQALAPLGLASNITSEEIMKMGREAGFSGDQSQLFTKAVIDSKDTLIALGGTTTQAIRNFGVLANSATKTRQQLDYIGSSLPEFLNFQTMYISTLTKSGRAINNTTQGIEELRDASFNVYTNMRKLAEVTGRSVDDQTKAMQLAAEQQNLQLSNLTKEAKAQELKDRANQLGEGVEKRRLLAEAENIKVELDRRKALTDFAATFMSAGNAVGLMEVMASENSSILTQNSVALNNLLQNYGGLQKFLQDYMQGTISLEQAQLIFGKSILQTTQNLEGLIGTGAAGREVLARFGVDAETTTKILPIMNQILGKSTETIKTEADIKTEAAKTEFEARLRAAESLTTLITQAGDTAIALNTVQKAAERTARIAADEARSKVPPFIAAAASLLGIIAGTVSLLLVARRALAGGVLAGGRVAVPGDFGLPSAGGTAGRTGTGGMLRGGARALGRIAAPLAIGMSAYDAYQGFTADSDAGIGERLKNAGSSALSGLTFGLLGSSPEEIKERQEKALDAQKETSTLLKDQQETERTNSAQAFINDTQSINYFDKIYKELLDQTLELEKLNSYGALQTGLMTGSIKPATPGMSTGPTGAMFTGADQQSYFRIPFGERYGSLRGQGSIFENQPTAAGGPVVSTNQSPLTGPATDAAAADPAGSRTGRTTRPPLDIKEVESSLIPIRSKSGATASVHKNYAQSFQGLINWLDGQNYKITSLGGYNDRNIAGTNIKSIHAYGGAIDINPMDNMGRNSDFPLGIGAVAKSLGLGWGSNFGKPDAMHFSIAGSEGGSIPGLEYGGRVTGPITALIGEGRTDELVQPLLDNSILDKLAKTPATELDASIKTEYTVKIESTMKDMISSINYLGEKLSNMQAETNFKLDTSNSYLRDFLKLRRA
jgi:hypothetical protein